MISAPKTLVIHHSAIEDAVQLPLIEKSHAGKYQESHVDEDSHVCYHYIVGLDATVKQLRSLSERAGCTRNQTVNLEAIHIVVAGNFEKNPPSPAQIVAIRNLVTRLDSIFHFERIEGHRHASPTACPGKLLIEALADVWRNVSTGQPYQISRYYSPEPGQPRYYREGPDAFKRDTEVNCGLFSPGYLEEMRLKSLNDPSIVVRDDGSVNGHYGDCIHTADGSRLKPSDAMKVVACPPDMPLGTKIHIEGVGDAECRDRGGAIKNRRLDLWMGYGTTGLLNIHRTTGGLMTVTIK